jgi:hypothetical protein
VLGEVLADRVDELAVQLVDRRHPAEEEVVLADLLQPLPRDAAAGRDVLEERDHVVGMLRSPERHEQQRVERADVHGRIVSRTFRAQNCDVAHHTSGGPEVILRSEPSCLPRRDAPPSATP